MSLDRHPENKQLEKMPQRVFTCYRTFSLQQR